MSLTFNIDNARILSPSEALAILASRGEWSRLAQAIAPMLTDSVVGSAVTFESLGLSVSDFKRTTASSTKAKGDVDYSGINAALRQYGLKTRETVDGFRAFYRPTDQKMAETIASYRESLAKAKAKANAARKAKAN